MSLFDQILECASGDVTGAVKLTEAEEKRVRLAVEQQVADVVSKIEPGTDLSSFKFPNKTFEPVKRYLGDEIASEKADLVKAEMRKIIKEYQDTIRYASALKRLRDSLAALQEEAQNYTE